MKIRNLLAPLAGLSLLVACSAAPDMRVDAKVQPVGVPGDPGRPTQYAVDLAVDYGAIVHFPTQLALSNRPKKLFIGETDRRGRSTGIAVDLLIQGEEARFDVARYEEGDVIETRVLKLSVPARAARD